MARQDKELNALLDEVAAAGGEIRQGKSQHYKVYVDGALVTSISKTCSDRRGLRNARSILCRAGVLAR